MTTIFCSNKLKDFLGKDFFISADKASESIYGDWNAHLFNIARRRVLILINNKSYYSVFFEDTKKADFKDFNSLFLNRLTEQLIFDKVIDPSEVLLTIHKYSTVTFSKTNNDKKAIGTMNDFIYNYRFSHVHPLWVDRSVLEKNNSINTTLTGAGRVGKRNYGRPIEDMQTLLNTSP